jgi:uncharacterized protein with PIN domain
MTRLFVDAMLGRLVTYLRMCGYDMAYALDEGIESSNCNGRSNPQRGYGRSDYR